MEETDEFGVLPGGADLAEGPISRGFRGRRESGAVAARLPPGQYLERGFPVLSAGPTPHTPLDRWDFTIVGSVTQPKRWTWDEFRALPHVGDRGHPLRDQVVEAGYTLGGSLGRHPP